LKSSLLEPDILISQDVMYQRRWELKKLSMMKVGFERPQLARLQVVVEWR
jgi:hypothetical protein